MTCWWRTNGINVLVTVLQIRAREEQRHGEMGEKSTAGQRPLTPLRINGYMYVPSRTLTLENEVVSALWRTNVVIEDTALK